ncbi:hypothetical protein [Allosalinactinospora lopnorensis]|uniref:hypothetical protein n=1 Tax=Allosalinactinospora lopnorensis TaxID=1352348 RepID=UPI001F28F737|nr:hypothetical protein [Allosalinactinospora lopnorensis]
MPYPHAALVQTWRALRTSAEALGEGERTRTIDVPGDVQGLVEDAEPDLCLLGTVDGAFEKALMSWWAEESVSASRGDQAIIPTPGRDLSRGDLHRLTEADTDVEGILATRLGVDTLRLLPVWRRDGAFHLHPHGTARLPEAPPAGARPSPAAVRTVMEHSIPVRPAGWQEAVAVDPPDWFADHPTLGNVLVVPFRDAVEPTVIPGVGDSAGYWPSTMPQRHRVAFSPDYGLFTAPLSSSPR